MRDLSARIGYDTGSMEAAHGAVLLKAMRRKESR